MIDNNVVCIRNGDFTTFTVNPRYNNSPVIQELTTMMAGDGSGNIDYYMCVYFSIPQNKDSNVYNFYKALDKLGISHLGGIESIEHRGILTTGQDVYFIDLNYENILDTEYNSCSDSDSGCN